MKLSASVVTSPLPSNLEYLYPSLKNKIVLRPKYFFLRTPLSPVPRFQSTESRMEFNMRIGISRKISTTTNMWTFLQGDFSALKTALNPIGIWHINSRVVYCLCLGCEKQIKLLSSGCPAYVSLLESWTYWNYLMFSKLKNEQSKWLHMCKWIESRIRRLCSHS